MRSLIHNEERACQPIDYSGIFEPPLCLTDVDGLWEYHNKGYLGVEVKYRGKSVPRGQSTALERLAVDLAVTKKAVVIVVDHEVDNPKEAVLLDTCKVREVFWGHIGKWQPPKKPCLAGDFMRAYKDWLDKL